LVLKQALHNAWHFAVFKQLSSLKKALFRAEARLTVMFIRISALLRYLKRSYEMNRYTVYLFALFVCCVFLSCELVNGADTTAENKTGQDNRREEETPEEEAPEETQQSIDLNAINRNEVLFSSVSDQYQDNPFLGGQWESAAGGGGYVYLYKTDGTVSSTHHCELQFTNQFSYVLYKNWLVLCGSEMNADRLEVKSIHIPKGAENTLVLFTRNPSTGALTGYDIFVKTAADPNPGNTGEGVTPPYTPFLGAWTGSDGGKYEFKPNGIYTVRFQGEQPVEYSYLVRGKTLVTLTHGQTESSDAAEVWTVKPGASQQVFSVKGNTIILDGLTLTKNP
jgi:hypothetical protein